jgi:dynein heavy chain 2
MGRIFVGLCQVGAWGCFDEFNRLEERILSAVSQQILHIQNGLLNSHREISLIGRNVRLNPDVGIFVTMNPGYAGRSNLPDNLKQLFRPVAMSAPDNELIAETLLFSEGFKHAKQLAAKIVSLFRLTKQLLSAQQHYDWGLRALKTVLNTGGQLIQRELKKGRKLDFAAEALLLIKSIRVNTISKLTYSDSKKYEYLQADMFPGIKSEDIAYEEL